MERQFLYSAVDTLSISKAQNFYGLQLFTPIRVITVSLFIFPNNDIIYILALASNQLLIATLLPLVIWH